MKIAFFDTHRFDREAFEESNRSFGHELVFFETRLTAQTAKLALGCDVVCSFVNDHLDQAALAILKQINIQLITLRCAGFNHVDLAAAAKLGLPVVRVPEYSPHAVAEHATALILSLNRKIHHAYVRVREQNFSLEGFVGFDLYGKTVGIIGTGRIGTVMAKIMTGFGCRVLLNDIKQDPNLLQANNMTYVDLKTLYNQSDIISLHLPLTKETKHMIDAQAFQQMKAGVMIINTSRGALIDTKALIQSLKNRHIGSAGLDVYEEEGGVFFSDLSNTILNDDVLARLMTFPNVLITSHQGFLTHEALNNIAKVTLQNISNLEHSKPLDNLVTV